MQFGDEPWKWAVVVILLGVLIVVGNQAYKSVYNPENQFDPPDDYLKGDSYDIERGAAPSGPGAGQPMEVPASLPIPIAEPPGSGTTPPPPPPVRHEGDLDWSKMDGSGQP